MLASRTVMGLWIVRHVVMLTIQMLLIPAICDSLSAQTNTVSLWGQFLPAFASAEQLQTVALDYENIFAYKHNALDYENIFAYKHNLSIGQQERAMVSMGANLRLQQLLSDLQAGRNVSIGILGGSVSWGFYMKRGVNDWFALFSTWLRQTFPAAKVASKNGCVPATTAEYVSMCLDKFVDTQNADLVFLEYSLNDGYVDTSVKTEHAMAFERLVRKLVHLPRRPAVVLMQVLPQGIRASASPLFWWSVQDHYGVLAQYYQLPWLSMRDAMWHEVVAGAPGFRVHEIYPEQEQGMQRHPSELGHKYMADVAVAMMQQVYMDMLLHPTPLDDAWQQRLTQVPEPMFENNHESNNLLCLIGEALPPVVVASKGWSWKNDGTADKPKWGYSTSTVGAVLQIKLDTRMTAGHATQATPSNTADNAASGTMRQHLSRSGVASGPADVALGDGATPGPGPHAATSAALQEASGTTEVTQRQGSRHPLSADGLLVQDPPAIGVHHFTAHTAQHTTAASRQAGYAAFDAPSVMREQSLSAMHLMGNMQGAVARLGSTNTLWVTKESGTSNAHGGTASPGQAHCKGCEQHQHQQQHQHTMLQPHRHLQQLDHDATWWEAQQAQEEQQARSKLEESNLGWQSGDILVWVGYTRTWRGGGKALMTCLGGCTCRNSTVDGYHRWKTTQSFMAKLFTQQAKDCIIQVEVLPQSSSNGTYFKVSGVMVTRRISSYDNGDYTDVLLLNAMEGEEFKLKTEG